MRRFLTVLRYQALLAVRSRVLLALSMILPTILLLLLGLVFNSELVEGFGTATGDPLAFPLWLVPGIVVANMISMSLLGNVGVLVNWREKDMLRGVEVTPMPIWQLMAARGICQVGVILAQAVVAGLLAAVVFGFRLELAHVVPALLAVVAGSVMFLALSQAIAACFRKVELATIVGQIAYPVMVFLTGVLLPLELLPQVFAAVAAATPSYLAVELLRGTVFLGLSGVSLLILAGVALWTTAGYVGSAWILRLRRAA